jgi:hypothetical protein
VILQITDEEYPLLLRVEWLFVSFSMIGLSVSTVMFTPQLKAIILKKFQHNRVRGGDEVMVGSIPIERNPVNQ